MPLALLPEPDLPEPLLPLPLQPEPPGFRGLKPEPLLPLPELPEPELPLPELPEPLLPLPGSPLPELPEALLPLPELPEALLPLPELPEPLLPLPSKAEPAGFTSEPAGSTPSAEAFRTTTCVPLKMSLTNVTAVALPATGVDSQTPPFRLQLRATPSLAMTVTGTPIGMFQWPASKPTGRTPTATTV